MFESLVSRVKDAWRRLARSSIVRWLRRRSAVPNKTPFDDAKAPPPSDSATILAPQEVALFHEPKPANIETPTAPALLTITPAQWLEGSASNPNGRLLPWVLIPPERRYRLYIPASIISDSAPVLSPTTRRAMVMMIHGCRQNAETFALATRMNALADLHGFAVLYPDQSDLANLHRCWNWFEPQTLMGRGEVAILMTMIEHAAARANVDPARICVAGLSSGGALAALLAFTHPERFSSVTVHSGLAPHAANSISSALTAMRNGASLNMAALTGQYWRAHQLPPPPLLIIQGDADTTVNPENADALLNLWKSVNQAESPAALIRSDTTAPATTTCRAVCSTRVYAAGDARPPALLAEYARVDGLAHAWSGGDATQLFTDAMGPDASEMIVGFAGMDQGILG